MGQLLVVLAR